MWAHDPRSAQDMSTVHNLCSPDYKLNLLILWNVWKKHGSPWKGSKITLAFQMLDKAWILCPLVMNKNIWWRICNLFTEKFMVVCGCIIAFGNVSGFSCQPESLLITSSCISGVQTAHHLQNEWRAFIAKIIGILCFIDTKQSRITWNAAGRAQRVTALACYLRFFFDTRPDLIQFWKSLGIW